MSTLVPWIIDTEHNSHWHYWNLTFLISKMIDTCSYWYLELLALAVFDSWNYLYSACLIKNMIDTWHDWLWHISYLEFLILNTIQNWWRLSSFIINLWCPNALVLCIYSKITSFRPSEVFFQETIQGSVVPRSMLTNMNYVEYQ